MIKTTIVKKGFKVVRFCCPCCNSPMMDDKAINAQTEGHVRCIICTAQVKWEEVKDLPEAESQKSKATAAICPICGGTGHVTAGFYDRPGNVDTWSTGKVGLEICHSCWGTGWIVVPDTYQQHKGGETSG